MRNVLPGKPQAKLQAVCTTQWEDLRLVVYLSGNAIVILSGPYDLLQTIYVDDHPELDAVAIDEASGNIAACGSKSVVIYKPYGKKEGVLKWSFQTSFKVEDQVINALTLSWGSEEELLVGSTALKLYQTAEDNTLIWNHTLPKPVKIASFSYDATLIASTGLHDRLIKLWRRQSFGSDDTRFDFTYLPHPTAVTAIHWRKLRKREHLIDNVLFSICADCKVRIWATTDPHGLQVLQLWEEIDMREAIQLREPGLACQAQERYAFIIDSKDFMYGTEKALKVSANGDHHGDHALEHLIEVSKTSPEVCVILDRRGNMSAWGLQNVGYKVRGKGDKFNVAHVENVNLSILEDVKSAELNVQFLGFCSLDPNFSFSLLVHHFDGRIAWYESKFDELFDPSPRRQRLHPRALWTGHDGSIKNIVRSGSGRTIVSCTHNNEELVWRQTHDTLTKVLTRLSSLKCPDKIHHSCVLGEGEFIVHLHHYRISLWDIRMSAGKEVDSCANHYEGEPLCLLPLQWPAIYSLSSFVAMITSKKKAIVWEIKSLSTDEQGIDPDARPTISLFCSSYFEMNDEFASVMPVQSVRLLPDSVSLGSSTKDRVIAYTDCGTARTFLATIDLEQQQVDWLISSTIETEIFMPSLASASSTRKIAMVDNGKTRLTIWDHWSAQLEHDAKFDVSDTIQNLDWSSTLEDQNVLAIGFPYKVVILAQMRFDFMNAGPCWAPIREIRTKELTSHPIGDSTWLGSGDLVVGAGNQLYVYDHSIGTPHDMVTHLPISSHQDNSLSIFNLVTYLNSPLPVFHPHFIAQCIMAGKLVHVQRILIRLYKTLKFFATGDELDFLISMSPKDFYTEPEDFPKAAQKEMGSYYTDFVEDDESESVTEELGASLNETLGNLTIPDLPNCEKIHLGNIVECFASAERYRRSMDVNAMRYFLFLKKEMISKAQSPRSQTIATWREIVWAFHSVSQDALVDLMQRQFHGRMQWEDARGSGIFMWMTDLPALRAQFEVIARNEYTKTYEKNPIDCSLYYLALRKKSVLIGLWRMAAWNREQSGTQKLLRNDFTESRWKTAALKNAYALLGKRRFEYAAAFFLLADRLQDAVNVCAHQMNDMQLAVAVARVYDGDDSPVLRSLLEEKVLPQAATEGNRWQATWAFWMLGRRDMAIRVLIFPMHTLINLPGPPTLQSKSYLSSEPALIVLYKQLREKTSRDLKGASIITPREEWIFVIQIARVYHRMGCGLLALDLLRNWKFLPQHKNGETTNGIHNTTTDPHESPRRRSSSVREDGMANGDSRIDGATQVIEKPAPTVFKEPDTNSLLDNFGF